MHDISQESLEDSRNLSQPLYILPNKNGLSNSQKKTLEERAQEIKSDVPIYAAIIRKTRLGAKKLMLVSSILFYI